MAGRPYGRYSRRFSKVVPNHASGVYLAEFGNGIIKVGQSGCIRARLIGLNQTCRAHGHEIGRFAAFIGCRSSEQACIDAIAAQATTAPGHVEYFHGIDYADALALILPVVESVATAIAHGEPSKQEAGA